MTSLTPTGIAYDDTAGPDPTTTIMFLPGWCGPRSVFTPLQERLDGVLRTVALDWRGHGGSKHAEADFGTADLVEDALAVIDHTGAERVVPVALSHAGWVAIELRRRLGPSRVPRLVFIDWMVLGAPPPFLDALAAMAAPGTTRGTVDQLRAMWLADLDLPPLDAYVAEMASYPDEMWSRAAREIAASFDRFGSPLDAVADLRPQPETLHLYAQPDDPGYLEAQRGFAAGHPWFEVVHLDAASHFPMFEVADSMADRIAEFARS